MKFWASSRTFHTVSSAVEKTRLAVEPLLNDKLAASRLANVDCLVAYIPTVTPPDKPVFQAKWSVVKKDKTVNCSPILRYDLFVTGTARDQIYEYVRGIATAVGLFPKLGLTAKDATEFQLILARIPEQIWEVDRPELVVEFLKSIRSPQWCRRGDRAYR